MGVYPLTFTYLLLGVPDAVEATGQRRADGLDFTASRFLRYGDGRFAHAMASIGGFVDAGASVGGTSGCPAGSPSPVRAMATCRCSAR
jgi:hypothetical protein